MIDLCAMATRLIDYVDGCKIIDFTEFIITNHRGFIVNFNLEEYFKVIQHKVDSFNGSELNSRKVIYKSKFCERAEELIESFDIKRIIDKECHVGASNEILDLID